VISLVCLRNSVLSGADFISFLVIGNEMAVDEQMRLELKKGIDKLKDSFDPKKGGTRNTVVVYAPDFGDAENKGYSYLTPRDQNSISFPTSPQYKKDEDLDLLFEDFMLTGSRNQKPEFVIVNNYVFVAPQRRFANPADGSAFVSGLNTAMEHTVYEVFQNRKQVREFHYDSDMLSLGFGLQKRVLGSTTSQGRTYNYKIKYSSGQEGEEHSIELPQLTLFVRDFVVYMPDETLADAIIKGEVPLSDVDGYPVSVRYADVLDHVRPPFEDKVPAKKDREERPIIVRPPAKTALPQRQPYAAASSAERRPSVSRYWPRMLTRDVFTMEYWASWIPRSAAARTPRIEAIRRSVEEQSTIDEMVSGEDSLNLR